MTATIGGQSGAALVTVEVPTATLTVVVGSGVVSSLPVGIVTYPVGMQLSYSFSARPGFKSPAVWLDDNPVPIVGAVTVSQNQTLVAMADSVIVLPPEDQPLAERLLAFRTTATPGTAWEALQAELGQLYQTMEPTEVRRRLLRAIAVTLDPAADAVPLWQAIQAAAGTGSPGPVADGPLGVPVTACEGLPDIVHGVETAFIYVNGIDTDLSEACTTASQHLRKLLPGSDPVKFPLGVVQNRSFKEVDASGWVCLRMIAIAVGEQQEGRAWAKLPACIAAFGWSKAADFVEAALQVYHRSPSSEESSHLADVVEAVWERGGRVVIVAHSQGNLIAHEALEQLRSRWTPESLACVGLVAVAPPKTMLRPSSEPASHSWIIEGLLAEDILLKLAFYAPAVSLSGTPRSPTALSALWDVRLFRYLVSSGGPLNELWKEVVAGKDLHAIDDSYLRDSESQLRLRVLVAAQASTVSNGCQAPPSAQETIAFNPSSVVFTAVTGTPLPLSRTISVVSGNGGALAGLSVLPPVYAAGPVTGWLGTPTLSGNSTPAALTLRPNTTNLPAGTYAAMVSIGAAGNVSSSPASLNVTYTVTAGPSGPLPPTLIGPGTAAAPGPVLSTLTPMFSWQRAEGATVHTIHIWDLTLPGEPVVYLDVVGQTSLLLPPGYLWAGRRYRWGITGYNDGLVVAQSAPFYFRTQETIPPPGGPTSRLLSAGYNHACGLVTIGEVFCWGSGEFGALGNGSTSLGVVPMPIVGGNAFTEVSAGSGHACSLTVAGAAWCWGWNLQGSLGDGSMMDSSVPVPVAGGHVFLQLSSGGGGTCALTAAGTAWCWGSNSSGQLGTGTTISFSPVPVLVSGGHAFAAISVGGFHRCALTVAGKAYCWGNNNSGQIGDGTTMPGSFSLPFPVTGGHTFGSISAGNEHTCAVTLAGIGYCWGLASRIGDGSVGMITSRFPRAIAGGHTFTAVSAGYDHSCAITPAGMAWCWGSNSSGQLGVGTNTPASLVPAAVAGGHSFTAISAGRGFTCGLTDFGTAWCWGLGSRLGNGTTVNSNIPVPVHGNLIFGPGAGGVGRPTGTSTRNEPRGEK